MNSQQIKKITIEGFKSIKNCTLNLNQINVLIGGNGAGKSNFIAIFKLLQNIIEGSLETYVSKSGGANSLMFNGRKETNSINVEFFFGVNSYSFKLIPTDEDKLIFENEYFNYDGAWKSKSYLGGGSFESKWKKGAYNKVDQYIKPILQYQKWRIYHFHDTSSSARVKQSHKVDNNVELLYDAGNLAAFLYRLKSEYNQHYVQIVKTIKIIAPYFQDFYLEPNISGDIIFRWKQHGSDDTFNSSQLSDGTLRFICLVTLLCQPHTLQPETIIVDEPELGLHPLAITVLSEIIRKASLKKQIILSTQSVDLLNEFQTSEIIVVDRDDAGTTFKRFEENELEEWIKDDYSMGDLWKKNIIGGRP